MDRRTFLQTTAAATALTSAGGSAALQADPVTQLTQQLNPSIQHAREIALKILKPSTRDLQHGLELHADSIVFDSYGFAPRAAIDGDAMKSLIEAGGSVAEIKDLREEMSMTRCATDDIERAEFKAAWRDVHFSKCRRRRSGPDDTDETPGKIHIRDRCDERRRFEGHRSG